MDRPGRDDCKIFDGGIWFSKSILEVMRMIYYDKERFAKVKPSCYYQAKRELISDFIRFIEQEEIENIR